MSSKLLQKFRVWLLLERDWSSVSLSTVLDGHTCQPISRREFRLYLQHREHSLENMLFHEWYLDYLNKWDELPLPLRAKSPAPPPMSFLHVSIPLDPQEGFFRSQSGSTDNLVLPEVWTPSIYTTEDAKFKDSIDAISQPFRPEVEQILSTFFIPGSDQELNLPYNIKDHVLKSAVKTTHPNVFKPVHDHVLRTMEQQSLQSFLTVAHGNINIKGIIFRYVMSTLFFLSILVILLVAHFMHMSRWFRIAVFPFTFFLVFTLISARAGTCFFKVPSRRRYLHDYEMCEIGRLSAFEEWDVKSMVKEWTTIADPALLRYNKALAIRALTLATSIAVLFTIVMVAIPY
ncbi:hypothetical protein BZG36_01300 [Bifiguratus adelaidae]|uniref:RGS domain-containing protein n=1 Tax=Bifiguratus adelaidae TaxID=1938954 RepID=A0A261Y585_9FUNG|nr:hypothetical protein BZG36_01300 [Bifiguratus adelaidae]